MPTWRINNATVLGNFVCAQWVPATAYALGDRVVCRIAYGVTVRRAYVYECTTAGTSDAVTEPTWPGSGTVADGLGALVWTTRNPNDGNWNNASCILHYVLNHAVTAAGDTIYVHNAHSENLTLGAVYVISGGTLAAPIRILCVDKASNTLSTGAVILSTHGNGIRFALHTYSYGITYSSPGNMTGYSGSHILEGNGTAVIRNSGTGYLSISPNIKFTILNGNYDIATTSKILSSGPLVWRKGALTGATPTKLFDYFGNITLECVDLSNLGNNDLVNVAAVGTGSITLTRCKLPATFDYTTGTWAGNQDVRVRIHHCANSNISYDFYEMDTLGTLKQDIVVYATGGANNGVTSFSMQMVSAASGFVEDGITAFESIAINGWTNSITEKTFTIEGIYDSLTNLQNDEVWAELQYPNDSSGLGLLVNTKCAILTAPSDLTVSTKDWTSTGITNVNKFKFTFTATPGKAGPIMARIYIAKAATTIYIDPMIVES